MPSVCFQLIQPVRGGGGVLSVCYSTSEGGVLSAFSQFSQWGGAHVCKLLLHKGGGGGGGHGYRVSEMRLVRVAKMRLVQVAEMRLVLVPEMRLVLVAKMRW